MPTIPLLRHYRPGAVFAYREGRAVRVAEFLQDVEHLAAVLPERGYVVNLCTDRFRFAVGLAAALQRRQVSLLPPSQTPDLVAQLSRRYPGCYCLSDEAEPNPSLETVFYPEPRVRGDSDPLPIPAFPSEQLAALVFTSGSTGQPVPHRKTWGALARSALVEAERLGVTTSPGMTILATVPAQHMYGLESTVLMGMHSGLALHAGRPFYPADIRAELAALPRPRGLVTTPIHLRVLLAEEAALPALDLLLCATAPLSPQLAAAAEQRFAVPLHEVYGFTEAGQVATRRTVYTPEWRCFDGVRLRQDERGTWVGGGHVEMEVLLNDVVERRDAETFLLLGRKADLVNVAGKRSSLANLNYHLNSIAGVQDGVFIVPEEDGDTPKRLTAFVVAPGLSSEELMGALRRRIDAAFLPRPLCLVDALPRNATGKLPRQALAELVIRYAAQAA